MDRTTGKVTWTLTTVDPSTGTLPTDVTAGFLPPNNANHDGEGFVNYSIQAKASDTTGTAINTRASVVFDENAAINTPTWHNTIDIGDPSSSVTALPDATDNSTFTVAWSGTDDGSGIATYDIYVSDNGGAYSLWQKDTTTTSATYTGQVGHTYTFYSVATDNVGHIESAHLKPDTQTTVIPHQAPVLISNSVQPLNTLLEEPTVNSGTLVSDLIKNAISNQGTAAVGIAVTGIDNRHGLWQYSIDNGTTWTAFSPDSVQLSFENNARLLAPTSLIRFVPNPNYFTPADASDRPTISFRAWDQTAGAIGSTVDVSGNNNGGSTAFSSASATDTITITSLNDLPVVTAPASLTLLPGSTTISGITVSEASADPGEYDSETVKLTVQYGTLTVKTDVAGGLSADNISGNGTATVTLTGSLAEINATLAAAQGLVYEGIRPGVDPLTVTVYDSDGEPINNSTSSTTQAISLNVADDLGQNLVWRNQATGQNGIWFMGNGISLASVASITDAPDLNWQIVATGDFNHDGNPDLVWRNRATGQNGIWLMNGTSLASVASITDVPDLNWQIQSVGDFNHDGHLSLVWRNQATGQNGIWFMGNGISLASVASITDAPDLNWQIVATGDFNHDGNPDLVWRNRATGQNGIWLMNGTSLTSVALITDAPDLNWQIEGVGDFNHDGNPDLVWRNRATGQNGIWLMNGTSLASVALITDVPDLNWQIEGVGDFNHDGSPDLVWRNRATGQNGIWLMNGTSLASVASITDVPDLNWQIQSVGDFNHDGNPDLVWRNRATGQNGIWLMNGTSLASIASIADVPDLNWQIEGVGSFNQD